jgi:hypothetical protein
MRALRSGTTREIPDERSSLDPWMASSRLLDRMRVVATNGHPSTQPLAAGDLALTNDGGLLLELVKAVLERGLTAELTGEGQQAQKASIPKNLMNAT